MSRRLLLAGAFAALAAIGISNAQIRQQVVNLIVPTSCTNQFLRSIATTGAGTCDTVVPGDLGGLGTGVATWLATPSSANLAAAVTGETGTGALVFADTPTLVTPILGTPTSVTLTNATGLPVSTGISGLGTGVATFLGTPSSANLAAAVTGETGTGALVFADGPTLTTPALGAATATTINGVTISNAAWTTYTPTVTSSTGTITSSTKTGRYQIVGKRMYISGDISITDAGTGAGVLFVTLPSNTAASNQYVGGINAATNVGAAGLISSGGATMVFVAVTSASIVVTGTILYFSGVLEIN